MLAALLKDRMTAENLSSRDVAEKVGVSHTTIIRMADDKNVDLETMSKVCDWLGVDLGHVIGAEKDQALLAKIALLIQAEPRLEQMFRSAVDDVEEGKLEVKDLQDIVEYAAFRLQRK